MSTTYEIRNNIEETREMTSVHFSGEIRLVDSNMLIDELEDNGEFKGVSESGIQSFYSWMEWNPEAAIVMPEIGVYEGKTYINNGRHRLLALASRGYRKIWVEVK